MTPRPSTEANADLVEYALRVGDDALVTAQRLAEWSARAPEMEEDIALSNIALDQLGVARLLLSAAGSWSGRTEDDLAFLRDDGDFRNCLLAELPNAGPTSSPGAPGDFGFTMARLLVLSAYQLLTYERLASSTLEAFADVAAKASKESRYHLDHAAQWTVRLGDGTDESRRRMQAAVDDVWPYIHELFVDDDLAVRLDEAGIAPLPSSLRSPWLDLVDDIVERATLVRPVDGWAPTGGRSGRHTEHLSYLLTEMQVLPRAHPGASW